MCDVQQRLQVLLHASRPTQCLLSVCLFSKLLKHWTLVSYMTPRQDSSLASDELGKQEETQFAANH